VHEEVDMVSEVAAEQAVHVSGDMASWYVSRRVEIPAGDLATLRLPASVTAPNGVSLTIGAPVPVDDEQYRTFDGVLTYPGMVTAKVRVEVDLNPYTSSYGEIGLRPARRAPRLLVSAERYFDGAWSVLDELASVLVEARRMAGRAA
jgi:hypothetical protein